MVGVCSWRTDWTAAPSLMLYTRSRLYFLRKLRSFSICSKMLEIFYRSVDASAIYFAVVCWGGGSSSRLTSGLTDWSVRLVTSLDMDWIHLIQWGTVVHLRQPSPPRQQSFFSIRLIQLFLAPQLMLNHTYLTNFSLSHIFSFFQLQMYMYIFLIVILYLN